MKRKTMFVLIVFILLLLSVIFANSYVQALSRQEKLQVKKEILEQEVQDNKINEEEAQQIYRNIEQRMTNCDNYCMQNENCEVYQQNDNCRKRNNECLQQNYNYHGKRHCM